MEGKKKRAWSRRTMSPIGKKIHRELQRRNMRVSDLARELGMNHDNYLSQIIYGAVGSGKYTNRINDFIRGKKIS